MAYLLTTAPNGYTAIYVYNSPEELTRTVSQLGLAEGTYATFPNLNSLPTGWESFPNGVTLTLGPTPSYGYSLDVAKAEAKQTTSATFSAQSSAVLRFVPPTILSSQAALPEGERLSVVNTAINTANQIANDMQMVYDAIDAATTLDELNAIVNPPAISGIIYLNRQGLDLDISGFASLVGVPATETYLFFPATGSTLAYLEEIESFTSLGVDVFALGDYTVQLKYAGTTIGTFNVTTTGGNNYDFSYVPPAPPA